MVGFSTGLGCGCCGNDGGPPTPCVGTFNLGTNYYYSDLDEQFASPTSVDSRWYIQTANTFGGSRPKTDYEWGGKWRYTEAKLSPSFNSGVQVNMGLAFAETNRTIFSLNTLTARWSQFFCTRAFPDPGGGFNAPLNSQSQASLGINGLFSVITRPGYANQSTYTNPNLFYAIATGISGSPFSTPTANPNQIDVELVYSFVNLTYVSGVFYNLEYNVTMTANGVTMINSTATKTVRSDSGSGSSACTLMTLGMYINADTISWANNQFRMVPLPSEYFRPFFDHYTITATWR